MCTRTISHYTGCGCRQPGTVQLCPEHVLLLQQMKASVGPRPECRNMKEESPARRLEDRTDRICKACLLHLRRMAARVVGRASYDGDSFNISELEDMETDAESGIGLGRGQGRRLTRSVGNGKA